STGTFSTSANWLTVTSAIHALPTYLRRRSSLLPRGVEPVLTCRHDQRARALLIDTVDLGKIIDGLFGQIFPSDDAAAGQRLRQVFIHAIHLQQIIRRLGTFDLFLTRNRLR